MVFVSKNLQRKCKWCDKEPKKNLTSGRNKGYYRTCGSEECLKKQYEDTHICRSKGRINKPIDLICAICGIEFLKKAANHKRYCLECVPDNSWRGRAQRYGIGFKQWNAILEAQNGTCALCNKNPEVVDHCHKTGRIRGLLCGACNTGISILERDSEFLQDAIRYIGGNYSIQK